MDLLKEWVEVGEREPIDTHPISIVESYRKYIFMKINPQIKRLDSLQGQAG